MILAAALLGAYFLGSVPASYLAGLLGKGIDLREHGSRNLGATNVWRVLGPRYAIPVGLFDLGKGAAAVLLGKVLLDGPWAPILTGAAAVLGHVFPVFLGFQGGKGVATATGVLVGLAPAPVGVAALVWGLVLAATGYVSLASLSGAAVFPIAAVLLASDQPHTLAVGVVLAVFVFYTHRGNIRRLIAGTESRFGRHRREA